MPSHRRLDELVVGNFNASVVPHSDWLADVCTCTSPGYLKSRALRRVGQAASLALSVGAPCLWGAR